MSTSAVKSYIRDEVETIPARDMEKLQVEILRDGMDRVLKRTLLQGGLSESGVTAKSIRSLEICAGCHSPSSTTCATTIRSGCLPFR